MTKTAASRIVVFGCGGYAKIAAEALMVSENFKDISFVGQAHEAGKTLLGLPVLSEESVLADAALTQGIIAVGDNARRQKIAEKIRKARPDFRFPIVVHPAATISRFAELGEGTIVLAGAVVNAAAVVGAHGSLYTQAVVEHDDRLADYVTLAPAAALGGNVTLGARSFVGLGAVVNHGLSLGADCVVGSGAAVIADLPDGSVAVGCPARIVRVRGSGEAYL